ncbi:hypothetical protein [Ralstonia pseudosolanacearum]|uniref:hypothetical protein n=1 Tax=Ralstonia pseudosolanacearum TaxID=1310165 RepID=UPI003CE6AB13
MATTKEIVIVELTVDSNGACDIEAVRGNVLNGIELQRANAGLTAEGDEDSAVTAVNVRSNNIVYSVISREDGDGAELLETRGVRVDLDDAKVLAQYVADKLANEISSETGQEVDVRPHDQDMIGGFMLSVPDQGIVATVEIHPTSLA